MIIVDLMARFKRYRYKIIIALLVIIILFYLYSQKGNFKNTFSFTSDPNMVTNTDKSISSLDKVNHIALSKLF